MQDPEKAPVPSPAAAADIERPDTLPQLYFPSSSTSSVTATTEAKEFERKLVWKIDLVVLPCLITIMFLAQIGRSDIANAKIAGMDKDLSLTPARYANIITAFIVGYLLFQPAGTMMLRKITPPIQLGVAMIAWGVVTACHVLAKNWISMLVLRAFVGIAETFSQGAVFYLSFWYTYKELALRGAIFQSLASIAGAFNGLLSYGIAMSLGGKNGWSAWRWIFLIEGILPIAFGFVVMALLPSLPEKNRFWFTPAEKVVLVERTRRTHNAEDSKIRPHLILAALKDPKIVMTCIAGGGNYYALSALTNFMPDIVRGMGYEAVQAQLMTVIIYACAVVTVIFWGYLSDRYNQRSIPIMISASVMAIGYLIMLTVPSDSTNVRFFACCLMAMGGFPVALLQLMWLVVNTVSYTKRAVGLAMFNIVSQLFGIAGNQSYQDPPLYRKGHAGAMGASLLTVVMTVLCFYHLKRKNATKRKRLQDPAQATKVAEERATSYDVIGDDHPDFFFTT
ncbi:major facilitator superfamily domain-containing protein [Pyronema domesticum]|uniref:Similar to Uncharacterized transporter C1002.16c acc. no. Q9US44 n=1 Tax=Pyronema omphalodes (strain CBS 100304) TaxID=1076935 RepID=U4KZA3_PYROM|nr:major facilitator superfamily domain-containing protein [Pyronema domesticum]CCX07775.1 Similar to Uncharacterized transporter C1002.16c; acc. no. Q9US44 [Pyronema omphalodes CBS 100304]